MIQPNRFHFLRSGTNLDIFSSAILTVRVEAVNPALREAVLISGNRLMSKTVTLHMKWSQLPPLIDIPDPDERSFDERVRQNRELQGLPPSKRLPPMTTPRRGF